MVVLGFAPGLSALAYSVLAFNDPHTLRATCVSCDVLHGSGHSIAAPMHVLTSSARVHRLVLSVVVQRDPPAAFAVGPQSGRGEPEPHLEAVVSMLTDFANYLRLPVVHLPTEEDLRAAMVEVYGGRLEVGERGLKKAVRCSLATPLPSKQRRILLATAAALGAAHYVRSELG